MRLYFYPVRVMILRTARSAKEIMTYTVEAADGKAGNADDVIIEDRTWSIHDLVVNIGGWLSGKRVLISPQSVKSICWPEFTIHVTLSHENINNSPEYDPAAPVHW